MSRLRVQSFTVSVDGFGAGPQQDRAHGLGIGGESLHDWLVPTRTFKSMSGGGKDGTTGVDGSWATTGVTDAIDDTSMKPIMFRSIRS